MCTLVITQWKISIALNPLMKMCKRQILRPTAFPFTGTIKNVLNFNTVTELIGLFSMCERLH